MRLVHLQSHRLDVQAQAIKHHERRGNGFVIAATFPHNPSEVLPRVLVCHFRREERRVQRVSFNDLADAAPENGADHDVCVEDQLSLVGHYAFFFASRRIRLKSSTAASTSDSSR